MSELILCNADNSNIRNVTIAGSNTLKNNGLLVYFTENSNFIGINSSDNEDGIYLDSSSYNTLTHNTVNNNSYRGINLYSSPYNTLTNNTANNNEHGIYIYDSSNFNRILGNKILNNNETGITISNCNRWGDCDEGNSNNTIEGNEILNNNVGIFSNASNSTINNNYVCENTQLDFNSTDWLSSYGDNNHCDKPDGWNDEGTTRCTYKCSSIGAIDLTPYIISTLTANQNQPTHIPITITNSGNANASELSAVKVTIKVTFNNNIIKEETRTVNMLYKSSETLYDFAFTPANTGSYNISIFVDPENKILESNEGNNKISESILVFGGCSSNAECNDGDNKTKDYCISGRCINFRFLSGKLIKQAPDVNKATLDTTVHFYYVLSGISGYCKNLSGTVAMHYDNSKKAYNKIPDIPDAGCSGVEVYMNVKNPSNDIKVVKSVLSVNGISDVPVRFDKFGGVGTYEVWIKNITIIDGSGNSVDYEFPDTKHYVFDVVEEEINIKTDIATKGYIKGIIGGVGATVGLVKAKAGVEGFVGVGAEFPRGYTVDYRGDNNFPDTDIKRSDVGLEVGRKAKISGGPEAEARAKMIGDIAKVSVGGGYGEIFCTPYESDVFEFGELSSNEEPFYMGSALMIVPDIISIQPIYCKIQPIYYNPLIGFPLSYISGLNTHMTSKTIGMAAGIKGNANVIGVNVGSENLGVDANLVSIGGKAEWGTERILSNNLKNLGFCSFNSKHFGVSVNINPRVSGSIEDKTKYDISASTSLFDWQAFSDKNKVCYYNNENEEKLELLRRGSTEGVDLEFDTEEIPKINSNQIKYIKDGYSDIVKRADISINAGSIIDDILKNMGDAQPIYKSSTIDEFIMGLMLELGIQAGLGIEIGAGGDLSGKITKNVEKGILDNNYGKLPVYKRSLEHYSKWKVAQISGEFTDKIFIQPVNEKLPEIKDKIKDKLSGAISNVIDGATQAVSGEVEHGKEKINHGLNALKGTVVSLTQPLNFWDMHIHIVDEYGREIYYNYSSGEFVNEIPGAFMIRNITADKIENYTNSTNITYNLHEAVFIPAGIKFKVYVDAKEAHNITEPYRLIAVTHDTETNTTGYDVIEDNITQNATIQYDVEINITKHQGNVTNITTALTNKNEEICGNGICNASANETIQTCPVDCDTIPPVIHSFNVTTNDNTTALKKIKITANVTDNAVIPLVFVNVTSLTNNKSELMELSYNETTGLYEIELIAYRSSMFNLTLVAYDNIKKSPMKTESTQIVTKINITKIQNYLNALNITLPYNISFYQDGVETKEIEGWRAFNLSINLTNFAIEFTNISADINLMNLPNIYTVRNVKANETPSGQDVLIKEMLYANQFSVDLFFGNNATYRTILLMKKQYDDFNVMKCDAILFGECVNPQIIPEQNYSISGDWVLMNISSFSGYGLINIRPDLTPISLVYTPSSPSINQEVRIYSVIENRGFGNASQVNVSLFVDNIYKDSKIISLNSSTQETVNFTWIAQSGIHNITIKVDPGNNINESYESNNNLTVSIAVCFTPNGTHYLNSSTIICPGVYNDVNLIINSSDVVLDCNGATLNGTGIKNYGYFGIDLSNRSNVTVKNCNVMNYFAGIYANNSSNSVLIGNTVNNNKYGIYLSSSSNNILINNTAGKNSEFDIYNDGSGNTGNNNTCDTTYNYNDPATTRCKNKYTECKVPNDIFDAVEMLEYLSGQKSLSNPSYCDLTNDDTINLLDVLTLIDKIVIEE